jgi:hypothetical protein
MQNPVPASQLANQPYMSCSLPSTGKEICNGLENISIASGVVSGNLLNSCNFNAADWATCFNCPATEPTLDNPTPNPAVSSTDLKFRHAVPSNCDSIWWDPIAGQCLCTTTSCSYNDTAVPLTTLTTNGTKNTSSSGTTAQQSSTVTSDSIRMMATALFGVTFSMGVAAAVMLL